MRKIFAGIAILFLLLPIVLVVACTPKEAKTFQVGMVFDSTIADDAFSTSCLRGAERAKKVINIGLEIAESLTAPETESLLRKYTESKQYNLIVCIGPTNTEPLRKLASDFPNQQFALVDGDIADKANISSLLSRDNESSFLAGAVAALATQTQQIGFIGGMDVPAIHRFLAGYQAGAKYINPECKIIVTYSGTWANDGKTNTLALQQYQQGADIIFAPAGAGSLGVIEASKQKNRYAIGVDTDQSPQGPRNVIASAVKYVDVAVFEAIKRSEGYAGQRFESGIQTAGLKEGGVGIVINNALPIITPEIKTRIAEIEKKIIAGEITVPES